MFMFQSGIRAAFWAVFVFWYGIWCLSLCFSIGFRLCLHFGFVFRAWVSASLGFGLGFLLVVLDLGFSYFCSFFSSFSDLGFAHISACFFLVFLLFFFFGIILWFLMSFGHSGGIAAVQWFPWL